MLLNLLCVGLGGFVGAILRALTGIFVSKIVLLSAFPYATLIVNVLGSFLIGMLLTSSYVLSNPNLKSFLTAGLLGGLTTFSTFSFDTLHNTLNGALAEIVAVALHCETVNTNDGKL